MRCVFGFMCVCALGVMPLVGCSETTGDGGSGGEAGSGGTAGDGGSGAVDPCDGVDCDDGETCIWGDCYANDCSLVEEGAGCAAPAGFFLVPGLCSGDACLPECEVLEEGSACHREDGVGICADGFCQERCDNDDDCSDLKDCTSDTCLSNGLCESTAVQDGTPCAGGTCEGGACALEGSVLPCSEDGIRNAVAAGGGPYALDCDEPTTVVLRATIRVDNDTILDGKGVTLDARNTADTTFRVDERVAVELDGFTLIGGDHAGIYNAGNLTLANSTATANPGWGIDNDGVLTVINSTVSGNTDAAQIFNQGSVALINSTVLAEVASAALSTSLSDVTTIEGCIIRGRCALADQPLTSNGYNIESPGDTCGFDQTGDQPGVTAVLLDLQPLADNGGPTQTHAITTDSAAFNAGSCEVDTDQRGVTRPQGPTCDVGAFELEVGP